jgi:hypothetical protein
MRKFSIAALDFGMGTETKEIFSIFRRPNPNPKPRKQRVYYEMNNYCATCRVKYPKGILTCSDGKHKIRTTGWHSPKEADVKRF